LKALVTQVDDVIERAKEAGVERFIVPGTDIESSKKAIELAEKYNEVYAAVGIHPHHTREISIPYAVSSIQELLSNKKVVAVGEVGIDKYYYRDTKYSKYVINPEFVELQKMAFLEQIKLAIKYKKSLIIHSREAAGETLSIMGDSSILDPLVGHIVFHCCEANEEVLKFALAHQIYIGVDGDATYSKKKEEFVKKIPLELLVLETDAPFLLPEPLRSEKKYPNEPKNIKLIAEKISQIKNISVEDLTKKTTENSIKLFNI
jgi:TatD DNase family protein